LILARKTSIAMVPLLILVWHKNYSLRRSNKVESVTGTAFLNFSNAPKMLCYLTYVYIWLPVGNHGEKLPPKWPDSGSRFQSKIFRIKIGCAADSNVTFGLTHYRTLHKGHIVNKYTYWSAGYEMSHRRKYVFDVTRHTEEHVSVWHHSLSDVTRKRREYMCMTSLVMRCQTKYVG
jgi:hypothetical protein